MRTLASFLVLLTSIAVYAVSDSDVAAALRRTSEVQITTAQTARVRAGKAEVRDFAQSVIEGQTKMNRDIAEVLNRQSLKPDMTQESIAFILGQTNQVKAWTDMTDMQASVNTAQLDRAYIDGQVEVHRQLIANLETQFIPNAQNAAFKTFLEKTKTDFQERLTKAQQIQTSLANQ